MNFDIIATGSQGNAVVLNRNILIDCGVPFSKLAQVKKDLKLVLLTHRHGDHFNPRTVRALHKERPTLRWGCCEWMVEPLVTAGVDKRVIDVFTPGYCMVYHDLYTIQPAALVHDVPNCGYHIWINSESIFYATDTATLAGVSAPGYTLYLIEANHKADELEARKAEKVAAGEFAYEFRVEGTHLSEAQALDWLGQNAGPNSLYVFLHQHQERKAAPLQGEL